MLGRAGGERRARGAFAEAEALLMARFADVTLAYLAAEFARRHAATGLVHRSPVS